MDQAIEATAAFAIFLIAFAFTQYHMGAIYGSLINEAAYPSLEAVACIVESSIIYKNGASTGDWLNWTPSTSIEDYITTPVCVKLGIRATCYYLTPTGEIEVFWTKQDPNFMAPESYLAKCIDAVFLEDGTFLRIEVYAS